MKRVGLLLIAGATLAIALATVLGVWHGEGPAKADSSMVVGLDMDPFNGGGNFCGGNGVDCTLGPIDRCTQVPNQADQEFQVDLFVQNLDNGFENWNENINFPASNIVPPNGVLQLWTEDVTNPAFVLPAQSTGSLLANFGADTPDAISPHSSSVQESGTTEGLWATRGVLDRMTLRVVTGAASGLYDLYLDGPPRGAYIDKDGTTYSVAQIWDGGMGGLHVGGYGIVALGVSCPAVTTTPTPTSTLTPTPTSTLTPTVSPTPTPTGTPSAGTVPLVAGWNDSCYQGQAGPIGDVFASLAAGVQAVYRMRPDQTFDRWFPARPELSTITTLNPFDQLFILMSDNADWTVQPAAQPPTSVALTSGWNSVCYLGGGKATADAAAGISGAFSIIYNLPPSQGWLRHIPGQPGLSNLARLETFTSVLILMTNPVGGTWAFSP